MAAKLKKIITRLIIVVLSVYFLLITVLVFFQDKIIFHAVTKSFETPKLFGVDYQEAKIPTEDGGYLDAWWLPQANYNNQTPVILYTHGNAASISMLAQISSIFHSYSWEALIFDYRGYASSSALPSGISEESLLSDSKSAYAWLKAKRPSQPIILWGHSLGSSVAANLSTKVPVSGVVLEGAFSSLLDAAKSHYPWVPIFSWMIKNKFETARYVSQRKPCPVLFIHGAKDTIVPLELGNLAFAAAIQPKQQIIIPNIGHIDFPSVQKEYRQEITKIVKNW